MDVRPFGRASHLPSRQILDLQSGSGGSRRSNGA